MKKMPAVIVRAKSLARNGRQFTVQIRFGMPRILVLCAAIAFMGTTAYAQMIAWDASSGLLPSDPSIGFESRFGLNGDSSWLTLQNGTMNVCDNSDTYQLSFQNTATVPSDLKSDWAFQIVLKINSHSRPLFDFGAATGIDVGDRRALLIIASDRVGFAGGDTFVNDQVCTMDTTNAFHTYLVVKSLETVNLYVDASSAPVISLAYDLFPSYANHGTAVTLTSTSNPGVADYDVKSFIYNVDGTYVPEPTALSLLAVGAFLIRGKNKTAKYAAR